MTFKEIGTKFSRETALRKLQLVIRLWPEGIAMTSLFARLFWSETSVFCISIIVFNDAMVSVTKERQGSVRWSLKVRLLKTCMNWVWVWYFPKTVCKVVDGRRPKDKMIIIANERNNDWYNVVPGAWERAAQPGFLCAQNSYQNLTEIWESLRSGVTPCVKWVLGNLYSQDTLKHIWKITLVRFQKIVKDVVEYCTCIF